MNEELAKRYAAQYAGGKKENLGITGGVVAPPKAKPIPTAKQQKGQPLGIVGNLVDKASKVGKQTASIVGSVGKQSAMYTKNAAVDIYQSFMGAGRTYAEAQTQPILNRYIEQASGSLDDSQRRVVEQYQAGKMRREDYEKALRDISNAQGKLSKETQRITKGPSPIKRAQDVAETAINVLSLGSAGLAQVAGKQALKAGSKEAVEALAREAATPLEKALLKIPAFSSLIERNLTQAAKIEAKKLAGETASQVILRNSKKIAADLLIKRPIFYQQNIGDAKKLYDQIVTGQYPDAIKTSAWLASQALEGGPLGVFFKSGSWLKGELRQLSLGTGSFIDEVGKRTDNKIAEELIRLKNSDPLKFKRDEKLWRIYAEGNLRMSNDDAAQAAEKFLYNHIVAGTDLNTLTYDDLVEEASRHYDASRVAKAIGKTKIKGYTQEQLANAVVVRWDSKMKRGAANAYAEGGLEGLKAHAQSNGYGEVRSLMDEIDNLIARGGTQQEIANRIKSIPTAVSEIDGIPIKMKKTLARTNYIVALPESGIRTTPYLDETDDLRKLTTAAVDGATDIFDPATAPQPVFSALRGALQSIGLSPESAQQGAQRELAKQVVTHLDELDVASNIGIKRGKGDFARGGQAILSKLQQYVESKQPSKVLAAVTGTFGAPRAAITDIRQLTPQEIVEALSTKAYKVSKSEARSISKAIMRSYLSMPLEMRGLGDKIVDTLYAANPLHKYYSRVQSALKYAYNPFFRAQERTETGILGVASADDPLKALARTVKSETPLLWNKTRNELDDAVRTLDTTGIFSSSMAGEAAQDQVLGRLTANITQGQKRDLAGLALDMANAKGVPLSTMALEYQDELADALRVIVQYPNKGILSSSLARTLNVAFFPMRYNTKVTMLAGKILAKQPPQIQRAVVHSIFSTRDWLKSDEGIRWQAEHADAISLFQWITPINSITYTMNLLGGGKPDSIAELGQLGGLPFGVISQMLDSQGLINLNRPYVQPATGDVFPKYIPETTKARAAVAVGDLLGSMFNYPGRVLGLPGKASSIRNAVRAFIDTNGSDFEKRVDTERLTDLQKQWIKVLKGDMSEETLDSLYTTPAPGQFNWYTLPPTDLPFKVVAPISQPRVIEPRTGLPSKKSGKKAKKVAQPMPS